MQKYQRSLLYCQAVFKTYSATSQHFQQIIDCQQSLLLQQVRFFNPRKKKQSGFSPRGFKGRQDIVSKQQEKNAKFDPVIVSPGVVQDPYRPKQSQNLDMTFGAWKEFYRRQVRSYVTWWALGMCGRQIKDFDQQSFRLEVVNNYEKINRSLAQGNLKQLSGLVTPDVYENMQSEINFRKKGGWDRIEWGLSSEPDARKDIIIKSATIIGQDQFNMNQNWIQIVLEIKTKQKFAVYNVKQELILGNPEESINVVDYWVFERHFKVNPQHYWRLAARLNMDKLPSVNPQNITDMSPLGIERKVDSTLLFG
eukprot:TRINITY_DN5224_c0_g2_i3.p1 TRINITY_DN5224_c0_g2~~TRINITY_DN5224_c0_g2_i3.p1  ORF type:complete len:324 (+),score=26.35 TRINITY_DN5224_c0_g2_i3:46-972(+)